MIEACQRESLGPRGRRDVTHGLAGWPAH
jgi:hypothetical protein